MDPTDARRLVRDLCRRSGVDPGAVLGRDRTIPVVLVRRRAIAAMSSAGMSLAEIGDVFGRHRTTVWAIVTGRRLRLLQLPGHAQACPRSTSHPVPARRP